MLLVLRLFALSAAALQLLVAAHILRRPVGPFRVALSTLLTLNGLAAARLAFLAEAPQTGERLFLVLDGATGPMLLAAGLLAWRFPDHDRRDRSGWALLAVGVALVGVVGVAGLSPNFFVPGRANPAYDWLHTLPALVGLAIAGVAFARAVLTARADRIGEAGLVALGFLPVMAENVATYIDQMAAPSGNHFLDNPPRLIGTIALFAAALASLAILAWPARRNRRWRMLLLLVMAASAAAYLAYHDVSVRPGSPQTFAVFLGTTLSFYVLRPIGAGLAYARGATLWSLFDVAVLCTLLALGKAFSAAVFGVPSDELRPADFLGASLALLLTVLVCTQARRLAGRRVSTDRPSADELLGRFLVDHYRLHGPDATATKQDIESATGITENNLAATLRRLERRLDPAAPPGTFVAERRVGVRGRKTYRLTAQGLAKLGPRPDI